MYFLFTNFHIQAHTHTHIHIAVALFPTLFGTVIFVAASHMLRRQLSQLPSCVPVCLTVRMQACLTAAGLSLKHKHTHTHTVGESVAKRVCSNCILIVCWSTHTCAIMGSIVLSLCQLFSVRAPQGRQRDRERVREQVCSQREQIEQCLA